MVKKQELLAQVWPDAFVEEGILAVHISALRRALNGAGGTSYIETVSRSGYRFTAPLIARHSTQPPSVEIAELFFCVSSSLFSLATRTPRRSSLALDAEGRYARFFNEAVGRLFLIRRDSYGFPHITLRDYILRIYDPEPSSDSYW